MKNLLNKELKLAIMPLNWFFLGFSLMTFLPGYPILLGSFFVCLGLYQSFLMCREANDTLYTVLLPIRKADTVAAKYLVVCFFEVVAFILMAVFTAIRMTILSDKGPYVKNALMNATPVYLAFVLIIFLLFNIVFVGGFYKTAYKIGKPFILFIIVTFIVVGIAEALIHVPSLQFLHDPAGQKLGIQFAALAVAAVLYIVLTMAAEKKSERRFETIDL